MQTCTDVGLSKLFPGTIPPCFFVGFAGLSSPYNQCLQVYMCIQEIRENLRPQNASRYGGSLKEKTSQ